MQKAIFITAVILCLLTHEGNSACVLSVRIVDLEHKLPVSEPIHSISAIDSDICMQSCHEMNECLTFFYNPGTRKCRMYGELNETDIQTEADSQCFTRVCDDSSIPEIANATFRAHTTKVKYFCDIGYVGYGNPILECRGAQWTSHQFECLPTDCGDLPTIQNTVTPNATSTVHQSQYTYQCDTMYHVVGTDNTITCLATGKWSEPNFKCKIASETCQTVLRSGNDFISAVYPLSITPSVTLVYCEMVKDNGGWMVIQRRIDNTVSFSRTQAEFKTGFGDPQGNFWIGNDNLNHVTKNGTYELRIDMMDSSDALLYAKYGTFMVGPGDNYVLTVSEYSGTAGDVLSSQSSKSFSFAIGWWNDNTPNLNGAYSSGINWNGKTMQKTVMMIRDKTG